MSKAEKVRKEIKKRYEYWREKESNSHSIESESRMSECQHLLLLFNSLQEEPVSNDLEEAAKIYEEDAVFYASRRISDYFKAGAQWQKEQDQSTIELAEDHAYLAGQEKIIEKACEWLNNFYSEDRHCYFVEEDIDNFKKAMEE